MAATPATLSRASRGYPIALISAAVLSTTAILIRYLVQAYQLPPMILAFWRDCMVAVALGPVLLLARPLLLRVKPAHLLYLVGYGLMLAIFNALWTYSVALNGAAIATVLVYCSAAFTAILGWLLLHETLGWVKLLAVVICLAGCVLVSEALDLRAWQNNLPGILTGVLAGLWYAIYSLMGRSASKRGLNPWTTLLYTFGFAALFLLLYNLLPAGFAPAVAAQPGSNNLFYLQNAWAGWAMLFLLAAGPTVLGFGLYNVSLAYLPSSIANLILTTEPVFTALIAYIFLGERLKGVQIAGGLIILGAVMLVRVTEGFSLGQTNFLKGFIQKLAPARRPPKPRLE